MKGRLAMPVQETIHNELEQLLEQARARATEAGLHGLPDGFPETVVPALAVAAARRFEEAGPSAELLRLRFDEIETRRRRAEQAAERLLARVATAAPADGFRWRGELSAAALFGLAGLCLDLILPERLNAREWAALSLAALLVALNIRVAPELVRRLFTRAGESARHWVAAASAKRLEREAGRLRARIFEAEDRNMRMAQWISRGQGLVLAEYRLYRDRAAAAAQLES